MRVTTLFKGLLGVDGVRVVAVELEGEPGRERVVVDLVRPPQRGLRCPRCGFRARVLSRTGFDGDLDSRMLSWGEEILRCHVETEEVP